MRLPSSGRVREMEIFRGISQHWLFNRLKFILNFTNLFEFFLLHLSESGRLEFLDNLRFLGVFLSSTLIFLSSNSSTLEEKQLNNTHKLIKRLGSAQNNYTSSSAARAAFLSASACLALAISCFTFIFAAHDVWRARSRTIEENLPGCRFIWRFCLIAIA